MTILSKESLILLGWSEEKEGKCFFNDVGLLDPKDQEYGQQVLTAWAEYLVRRKNCLKCKGSLTVCDGHYHDYIVCYKLHCITCLVLRSAEVHFPDLVDF